MAKDELSKVYAGSMIAVDRVVELIQQETNVEELTDFTNKIEAARQLDRKNIARRRYFGELGIHSRRQIGRLIRQAQAQGIVKTGGRTNCGNVPQLSICEFIGLPDKEARDLSRRSQKVASIPDDVLADYVSTQIGDEKDITVNGLMTFYKRHVKELKATERREANPQAMDILDDLAGAESKFSTVYADPPWRYSNQGTRAATDNHYDTMTVDEICDLPIVDLVADEAMLYLWTTNGFLIEALTRVIPAWGFEFKSTMVWVKPQMGIGNYVRNSHELLLIANRGGLIPNGKSQKSWLAEPDDSCIQANRTKHSTKPDIFRSRIEEMSPGPRIELFAREAFNGWTAWGNQISLDRRLIS